jgi:hypothetical protein
MAEESWQCLPTILGLGNSGLRLSNPFEGDTAMIRTKVLAMLVPLAIMAVVVSDARAEKKTVQLEKEWKGSVDDESLAKNSPAVISDAKALEKLWNAWRIEGKVPSVDFKKQLIILTTTSGSKLRLSASLDDKGNLAVLGLSTMDLRPGVRYVIATVSREGVKTVNGKKLPKE